MDQIPMKKHHGDPPACVDCVNFCRDGALCESDCCSTFDNVYGRMSINASQARKDDAMCGQRARFFEPRPEPPWLERNFSLVLLVFVAIVAFAWSYSGNWN
jgi:hypothetical protein